MNAMTAQERLELADRLRHLAADTIEKVNEDRDRQYILEDLITRILDVASDVDFRGPSLELAAMAGSRPAYDLAPREDFPRLDGGPMPPHGDCPYDHSHTRQWCGFDSCRES